MLPQYENLRFEIRKLDAQGKQQEAIQKINSYLKKVKEDNIQGNDEDLWFGYYANCMMKSKTSDFSDVKTVVKSLKKAIRYRVMDEQCVKSIWMLAMYYSKCYLSTHVAVIKKYYDTCEKYYRINRENYYLARVLSNKAKVLHDVKAAEEAINIYDKLLQNGEVEIDDYEGLLENCIIAYLYNKNYIAAYKLLHKITDSTLFNILNEQMSNQTPIKMVVDI